MMEREKAVVLLLTCLIFLFEIQATDIEVTSSDGKIRYKYVGCYRDHGLNRTLPWHYFNAKKYVNWHKEEDYNFKEVIDMCAVHAHSRSDLSFFGVQFFGECWGGGVDAFYNRFGKSKNCLEFPGVPGVGKSWTNAVYKIVFECEVKGVRYRDGESFYIPQNPVKYNDIGCQYCSCDRGVTNCNRNIKCDFFFPCDKFIPASQGQCCPTCACYHNNKSYQNGQTWINRQWGNCFEFTCVRGQAKCEKAMQCSANCPNPVYEPDKCCPTCRAGAPTTQAAFTVPEEKTRAPPIMPPGFPWKLKRSLKLKKRTKRSIN